MFNKNCCDGIYNSFDVHFTSACDNKCSHCIDMRFAGLGIKKPDPKAIARTIIENQKGYDDVLFLGGEPCLFLKELVQCIELIQKHTTLKVYVTTSVPKTCYDNPALFNKLMHNIDGINISVQHYREDVADEIRKVKSTYDRQAFYANMPFKHKVRVNLNIVKPYLYTEEDITDCLWHYDQMGFNEIKLSEIQHGKDCYVSFEDTFKYKMKSPYFSGCQTYLNITNMDTPLLLKRSCFLCEETLKASVMDGVKVLYKTISKKKNGKYAVVYGDGTLTNKWI